MKYLFFALSLSSILFAGSTDDFLFRNHTFNETTLPYRLYIPDTESQQPLPIILTLHGAGERGSDNIIQITKNSIASVWVRDTTEAKYPCYVVSPQCPTNKWWTSYNSLIYNLMDSLITELNVDTNRVYITGLSMGGYGSWSLIQSRPDYFTAAAILCGAGNPALLESLDYLPPIWNFHGKEDKTVSPNNSRLCIKAIIARGENVIYTECNDTVCEKMVTSKIDSLIKMGTDYLYTEYEGLGHSIWTQTYNNSLMQKWLFSKSKSDNVVDVESPNVTNPDFCLSQNYPNPFNPETNIEYSIPNSLETSNRTSLKIFNTLGQEVATLVNKTQSSGTYNIKFDASLLPSGIYIYRLIAGNHIHSRKMMLIK